MSRTPALSPSLLAILGGVAMLGAPGGASAQSIDPIAQADRNGDGSVTKQELLDMRAASFARLDQNGDGFIDAKDSPPMGPAKKQFEGIFAQIKLADADLDGRVSKQEMLGASTPLFDVADKDRNGVLSAEEIAAMRVAGD